MNRLQQWLQSYGVYILATFAVWLPLLAPGYILTLDAVFTPTLRMPEALTNDYPFYVLLHVLDIILPSEVIQKMLFFAIIPLAAIGLHKLLYLVRDEQKTSWRWGVYIASLFFAINPFTYSRFMAGQYLVLLGYALLPWFASALIRFMGKPNLRTSGAVAGLTLAIGCISPHTLGLLAVIVLGIVIGSSWRDRSTAKETKLKAAAPKRLLHYGLIALAIVVVGSSYWLVPTILGHGDTASTIRQFDSQHAAAFATEGENVFEKFANVLRLQGFWAERHSLYLLPQDQLPGWGTIRLLVWALVATGMVVLWRQRRRLAVIGLILAAAGLLLGSGVGQSLLTAIGYREPHKFVGLLALAYAVAISFGLAYVLERVQRASRGWFTATACAALVVILLFTPTMYGGFSSQLSLRNYPADWAELNQRLKQDPSANAIFLPWHQYMSFGFAGRVIANPAAHYFDTPVTGSNNPELEGITQPQNDPRTAGINAVITSAAMRHDLGARLARYNVRYIILAKEYDYRKYAYLDSQQDLAVSWQGSTIMLYRNTAWKEQT